VGDATTVEQQGLDAIQHANEAINAQGKTEEYTENLLSTCAGERQWGTGPNRRDLDPASIVPGMPEQVAFTRGSPAVARVMAHCR
jgi:hypothetical protein